MFINRKGGTRYELERLFKITISCRAGKWFCSFACEVEDIDYCENQATVGIDVGIKELAACWDGEETIMYHNVRASNKLAKKKRKLNKELSRSKKGGENREKVKQKLQRLYLRESNLRADNTHKLASEVSHTYENVGLEKLNVNGMVKNHKLARATLDGNFSEIRRQFQYKAGQVVNIPSFFLSVFFFALFAGLP